MSGHTPEPLEAVGNFVRTSMAQSVGKPRGVLVAECRDADGFAHSDEAKANARLFAAASDLLEALQDMLAVHGVTHEYVERRGLPHSWAELSDKARAAIAKATGT